MSYLVPLLFAVMGFRDWWEGDDLKRIGSEYGAIRHHAAGIGEMVLGLVFLGVAISRGSSVFWGFFVATGAIFVFFAGLFFLWRRKRMVDPGPKEAQMRVAELALVAGGLALVVYGILQ